MMKIVHNFIFQNSLENQSMLLLILLITTIILIGLVVLLLRNFFCWYLRINEINKQLVSINGNIHNLSSKIAYLIKINSNKKIIPPNSIIIKPVTPQEKGVSNSNSDTLDQIKLNPRNLKEIGKGNPEKNYDDDLLAKAIESSR